MRAAVERGLHTVHTLRMRALVDPRAGVGTRALLASGFWQRRCGGTWETDVQLFAGRIVAALSVPDQVECNRDRRPFRSRCRHEVLQRAGGDAQDRVQIARRGPGRQAPRRPGTAAWTRQDEQQKNRA